MDTIKKLVDYGADSDLVDNNGQTPMYYAIKHGKYEVAEYLLQRGAKTNIVDKKGLGLVQFARRQNKPAFIDLLVKYGAQPPHDTASQKKQDKSKAAAQKVKVNERKIPQRYQLTILKDGQYQPVSKEEWAKFKEENPDLVKYFEEPSEEVMKTLPVPDVPETAPIYDNWDKVAKRLVNNLWKH